MAYAYAYAPSFVYLLRVAVGVVSSSRYLPWQLRLGSLVFDQDIRIRRQSLYAWLTSGSGKPFQPRTRQCFISSHLYNVNCNIDKFDPVVMGGVGHRIRRRYDDIDCFTRGDDASSRVIWSDSDFSPSTSSLTIFLRRLVEASYSVDRILFDRLSYKNKIKTIDPRLHNVMSGEHFICTMLMFHTSAFLHIGMPFSLWPVARLSGSVARCYFAMTDYCLILGVFFNRLHGSTTID